MFVRLALLAIVVLGGGCARVKPWQREDLARRCMVPSRDPADGEYRARLAESKTGGGIPGDAPGGGCGCTQ